MNNSDVKIEPSDTLLLLMKIVASIDDIPLSSVYAFI
jgi:hypothetical protein